MANWGVKGQTFAPFAFLLYLCIVFRIVEQASSTPYVQKKWRSKKKITIYLRKSNICCNFVASFQRKRRQSPSVVRRLHIFKANNTNWIHRNLASFTGIVYNWRMLVHVWCTTFAVFVIRAMREPL